MHSIVNLPSFVLAGILLNLTPGQDTMYILGRSISQGRKAGFFSALGIGTGSLFHIAASAFGLSAILLSSALIFTVIKFIGAGYLIYLGIRMASGKGSFPADGEFNRSSRASYLKIYKQAILTNVLNPKVALFFLAFLPQFIDPSKADGPTPFLILGGIFLTTGTIWCLIVARFSAFLAQRLRGNAVFSRYIRKCCGGLFVLLGIKLALEKG